MVRSPVAAIIPLTAQEAMDLYQSLKHYNSGHDDGEAVLKDNEELFGKIFRLLEVQIT